MSIEARLFKVAFRLELIDDRPFLGATELEATRQFARKRSKLAHWTALSSAGKSGGTPLRSHHGLRWCNSGPAFPGATSTFATTHWSVVLAASGNESVSAQAALATLCQAYWYPLYAHVRRRGHDPESARDLTQGFFAELLAKDSIARADRERGRFRTFLLAALDHFLHHQHRDAQALKRGGGREFISWDAQDAEQRYTLEPVDDRSPDREFDRRWALATLEKVRHQLRNEFLLAGKMELFNALRPHLSGDLEVVPYAQVATQLNMTVVAVKVTVHRLRQRYGELLRQEVAHTLADPGGVEEEIRQLILALSG